LEKIDSHSYLVNIFIIKMSFKKISELTPLSFNDLNVNTDLLAIVDINTNETKHIPANYLQSGSFSGSFTGDGSGLINISSSAITGLNLSAIVTGSVTASVDTGVNSLLVVSGSTTLFNIKNNGGVEYGFAVTASGNFSHAEGFQTTTGGTNGYLATSIVSGVVTLSGSYGNVSTDYGVGDYLYLNDLDYDDNYSVIGLKIDSASFNGTETEIYLVDVSINTTTAVVGKLNAGITNWIGDQTYRGDWSHAEGYNTYAIGIHSHTEGSLSIAVGSNSHAEGLETQAVGDFSHTEGEITQAIGYASHAEGNQTITSGSYSHTEGEITQAIGNASHAEGNQTITYGNYSHAEGLGTQTVGNASHAEGNQTITSGSYSHAEGYGTQTVGYASHAEGGVTQAIGDYSHAEGRQTKSSGSYSHAEGRDTIALGEYSHAEGGASKTQVIAKGNYSHAEGDGSISSGSYSHAEGIETISIGLGSHSEGILSQAIGEASHAEGYNTRSVGSYSHASGFQTIASGSYQTVTGIFNTEGDSTSLFIVGNGNTTGSRSDAFKVRMSGSIVLSTTQSIAPSWTGVDGEIVSATVGGSYYLYMWMNGDWRSSSFA
jgi:hypothetical protein